VIDFEPKLQLEMEVFASRTRLENFLLVFSLSGKAANTQGNKAKYLNEVKLFI
jgi:hypothetical protein